MRRDRPVILITGFGPFPGAPRNASSLLAESVAEAGKHRLPGFALHAATLPTEWRAGPSHLTTLLEELKPAVALHFGISRRARGFVVETRARNKMQYALDACGESPVGDCIAEGSPAEILVTLPTGPMVERLRRMGLPVQLSRDAGGYLCNSILYHSLDHARRSAGDSLGPRRGFVHIPDRLLGEARGESRRAAVSRLDWNGALEGGQAILAICAGIGERAG